MPLENGQSAKPEESPFRQALERFKDEHLQGAESEKFQFTDLAGLKLAIKDIQDDQAKKNKMRNLTRLKAFLEGMEQYEKIIEVFLNAATYLAFVWGPMKFLLTTTNNFVKAFDALLDMYEDIGEQIGVLEKYNNMFDWKEKTHMRTVLEMIYIDILDFHAKALSYFRQKAWRAMFHATWKTFRTRFSNPIENFKRHRHLLENHATIILFEELKDIRNSQEREIKSLHEIAKVQQQDRVRAWLAHEDMILDQNKHKSTRREYPGTGRWILKKRLIRSWLDWDMQIEPTIWLTGIPGAGKTMLASIIIEEAAKQADSLAIFFYCKDGHDNGNNFLSVARSLLHQLSHGDENLTAYIDTEIWKSGQTSLKRPELAKRLLKVACHSRERLYIVIDGLDECAKGQPKEVVSWLQDVLKADATSMDDNCADLPSGDTEIRCLLVSQNDGECSRLLKKYPTLEIESSDNASDIKVYCRRQEQNIREKHPRAGIVENSISNRVVELSDGMFLFAKLVMENLLAQIKANRLREEIQWLDDNSQKQGVVNKLHQAYSRIIRRIGDVEDPEHRKDALQVLAWVVVAKRNLAWHEIQGAMSVDTQSRSVDFDGRALAVGPKELCGSLVDVKAGFITLVHSSARLFLIQQGTLSPPFEHLQLATISACYLSLDQFDPGLDQDDLESNALQGNYAFAHYAVTHWLDHVRSAIAPAEKDRILDSDLLRNLNKELQQLVEKRLPGLPVRNIPTSFTEPFNSLLSDQPPDFRNKFEQAALEWSQRMSGKSKQGKTDDSMNHLTSLERFMARLHVTLSNLDQQHRLSSDIQDLQHFHGTRLHRCDSANCRFFYLGFRKKEERESHANRHTRPWFCNFSSCPYSSIGFSSQGNLDAHLTAAHGTEATIHVQSGLFPVLDDPGSIDVRAAIKGGNLAAVQRWAEQFGEQIPLEKVMSERGYIYRGSLLARACAAHNDDISIYLLSKVAGLETVRYNVLEWLLAHHQVGVVRWFFSGPSSTAESLKNYQGRVYNMLRNDTFAKNEDIALLLLKSFPDWTSSGTTNGRKVCSQLARLGFTSCVRYLVDDCGFDTDYKNSRGHANAPLMIAAGAGHVNLVQFLLSRSSEDALKRETTRGTSAFFAASQGHEPIVRLLVDDPTSEEFQRLLGICQIRHAAIEGDMSTISKLMDQEDFPIDMPDSDLYSPFLHAVENGRTSIVDMLLSSGGNRVKVDRRCKCHHRYFPVVSTSRENRADALHIACVNGHTKIIKLLLQHGGINLERYVAMNNTFYRQTKSQGNTPNFPINVGFNAVTIADTLGFVEIKKLLESTISTKRLLGNSEKLSTQIVDVDVQERTVGKASDSSDEEGNGHSVGSDEESEVDADESVE